MVMNGDAARALQRDWDNVPEANREEGLRAFWRKQYNGLTIDKTETSFDDGLGKLTWTASGKIVMEWDPEYNTYEPYDMGLGYRADFTRPKGTDADAPYSVGFPVYERTTETIRLPSTTWFSVTGTDIDTRVAGQEFRRKARVEDGRFFAETNVRSISPEFPAKDTAEAQRVLLEMSRNDLYLKKSKSYVPTAKELQATAGTKLDAAADYGNRGVQSMLRGLSEQALADFDEALRRDATLESALIGRATVRTQLSQFDAARADLQVVLTQNPGSLMARRMLASLEMMAGRLELALESINQVVDKAHTAGDLLSRGMIHALRGNPELALQDCNAAIASDRSIVPAYFLKAVVLRDLNRGKEIAGVAEALLQAQAGTTDGILDAANLLVDAGEGARAKELLDRNLRERSSTQLYPLRARIRDDKKGALTDLQEALKPDPESAPVHMAVVTALLSHKWYAEALAALAPMEKLSGVTARSANLRGVSLWHLGDRKAAQAAFEQARTKVTTPTTYNSICWDKAVFDAALDEALKDCDLALEGRPDCSACMDSRAFVLLRMGRMQESVTSYDESLKTRPTEGYSLFGRGLARLRLGEREAGEQDILKARVTTPGVESAFASYGVTR
jgi:tetratricopeptide (TPR) repeat protein